MVACRKPRDTHGLSCGNESNMWEFTEAAVQRNKNYKEPQIAIGTQARDASSQFVRQ